MKKKKIKIPKQLLLFLVMVVMCMIPVNVFAASKAPSCAATQNVYYTRYTSFVYGVDYSNFIYVKNIKKNAKIILPKDDGVLRVVQSKNGAPVVAVDLWWALKNTSTVKFDVIQDGKTYHLKCKLIKKQAEFPFKSLKIGGKVHAKKNMSYLTDNFVKGAASKSTKISVVPKAGVKITEILVNGKAIKNGGTADLSLKDANVKIKFQYTKPNKVKNYNALQFKSVKEDYSYDMFYRLQKMY